MNTDDPSELESVDVKETAEPLPPELEAIVLEALESGEATELTKSDWDAVRREVLRRVSDRSK